MTKHSFWQKFKAFFFRLLAIGFVLLLFLVIYLDSQVRDEFDQQAWSIPAKVYARPLAFSLGQSLSLKDLLAELDLLGYRQTIKANNQGEFERYGNTLVINTRRFQFWDGQQDAHVIELTIEQDKVVTLKDFASQKGVNFMRLDPLLLGNINTGNNEDRQLISLEQLPENFIAALLITEDRDFYNHMGISFKGIARALWSNVSAGEVRQGGSTLTQQLMKNHFLSNERTIWRKMREAIMAVLTEFHYDKEAILQAYINEVYLGQNRTTGIYGFARASEFYFDRPITKLNLSQVALLVGMVKGPSYYNPRRNPERAKQRRDLVLSIMLEQGLITKEAFEDATKRSLMVVAKPRGRTSKVPAFMGFIKRELRQEYSLSELNTQGLRLFTSLDPLVQSRAEKSLSTRLSKIEANRGIDKRTLQGAVIVSDVKSGDILAMVGDRSANYVGFNRAIDAYRQTGSVIKPFVYLRALQNSDNFNLLTPIEDTPFSLQGSDGSVWTPKNYDGKNHGEIPLMEGLVNSYNLATARLALSVGIDEVADTIIDAGFERSLPAFPSIALGAKEMSPLEVSRLYQVIANDGVGIRSAGIVAVQDHQGQLLQRFPRKTQQHFEAENIFLIKYLLTQVVERGTAKAIGASFPSTQFAGKTGTTNDLRDSWYAGFGGEKLAVVWVGRDDNQPSGLTGATGALKVWQDLFLQVDESSVDTRAPDGLVWGYRSSGIFSAFTACKNEVLIPFYTYQLPSEYKTCEP
ncbi:penicillin-binding protein 1B [Aliikangiella marina]|uniref:Penicillin-binding protein 1B n=1 Tax=Aliikangiella marina TaxID=1712262 RepID=A0A545TCD2_9GAMM|nr:penicillin-binding protein 1B [Aliikangiella marina]TQV74877.1 penicillin-binding protein 1B [Aliikangiella marina]